jgi:hypothetical protein
VESTIGPRQPGAGDTTRQRISYVDDHHVVVNKQGQARRARNAAAARASSVARARRVRTEKRLSRTLGGIQVEYHLDPESGRHDGFLITRHVAERWLAAHDGDAPGGTGPPDRDLPAE